MTRYPAIGFYIWRPNVFRLKLAHHRPIGAIGQVVKKLWVNSSLQDLDRAACKTKLGHSGMGASKTTDFFFDLL